jgi:hypothetical protein
MKNIKNNKLVPHTALLFAMLTITMHSWAGGFTHLPRSLGPFELGMSPEQFQRLTGVTPEPCPICIQKELFATLNGDRASRIANNTMIGDGVDFFFYENKLYHIGVSPAIKDLRGTRQEFSDVFGGQGKVVKTGNGTEQLRWEEPETVLTINYRPEDNEVFSVNYFDWNLKEERDWRESLLFQNTAGLQ